MFGAGRPARTEPSAIASPLFDAISITLRGGTRFTCVGEQPWALFSAPPTSQAESNPEIVGLVSLAICAAQGAPCKRAGGLRGRRAREHASTAEERAVHAVLPCCRPLESLATSREAVSKLLGSATQHGAGCGVQVCEGVERSRGRWSRVRWEQRALRTPSPLLPHLRGAVRGGAWPWRHRQRTREEAIEQLIELSSDQTGWRLLVPVSFFVPFYPPRG